MGNVVTEAGMQQDGQKVEAILNMLPPTDVSSLQRLLGIAKYVSQYIPNSSSITAPLRELLKKNSEWKWTEKHNVALEQLKAALRRAPTLSFYDVDEP